MKKAIAFLATIAMAASLSAAEFPDLSIKEVRELSESKKAVIIDVNGTESYNKGHVPGALNFAAVKDDLASKLPKDKTTPIVAYCGNPRCQAYQAAAKAASKLGYKNVKHMSAGIAGWKEAGEKIEKGEPKKDS